VSETQPRRQLIPTRRSALIGGAGVAGISILAACSSGGPADRTKQPKSGTRVVKVSRVRVGGATEVTLADGAPAIVARPTAGRVVCFSAICTHLGCVVAPVGSTLDCPCHGSRFDALTGTVVRGPAVRPLPRIPVTVKNGEVVTT